MKVVLYMAMSVNGCIAKENNETPWSDAVWESYYKIAKQFKAIILGRKTYEIMKDVKIIAMSRRKVADLILPPPRSGYHCN